MVSLDSRCLARFAGLDTVVKAGLGVLLVAVVTTGSADADLWGHVRFGQDILAAGHVVKVDPYSFTSDREWVNHEWLAEVVMALAWSAGGTAGLVTLKALLLLATLSLVGWSAHRVGLPPWGAWVLVIVAAVGIVPRATTVRPQLFSLALFATQLCILAEHEVRQLRWPLAGLPLLYAPWVNLHGGWLVGGGVLALWALGQALERRLPWADRALLFGAGVLSLLGTLANPYGTGMWRFLADTVGISRPHIADWKPAWSSVALVVPLVSVTVVAGLALAQRSGRRAPTRLAILTALWCLALAVSRLDAFFAIAVSILLAIPIVEAVRRWLPRRVQPPQPPSELLGRALINGVVVLVLLAVATAGVRSNASCLSFGDPATAPEPEAVEFIRQSGLRGRFLTHYNYGEYAIWHLAPSVRISMDGRRETVYTDAIVDAHFRFYAAPDPKFPEAIGADVVWLPNGFRAGGALEPAGWHAVFAGPVSTIWTREPTVPTAQAEFEPPTGTRCFPSL